MSFEFRSKTRLLATSLLLGALAACAHGQKAPPAGSVDADKFLYTRGSELLAKKNWISAREYFRRVVDSYPQSTYRADSKIGVGDSYLGEGRTESLVLAVNEFREFLSFFPLNPRADYAQYRLTLAQSKQILKAERDQTNTMDTLAEVKKFIDSYPKSEYRPEVDKIYRVARDRLSESEFRVGMLYYRANGMAGALGRFTAILNDDPAYSKRDQVLFYTAEACVKVIAAPQAIVYFDKLIAEFPKSKFTRIAQKKVAILKAQAEGKSGG